MRTDHQENTITRILILLLLPVFIASCATGPNDVSASEQRQSQESVDFGNQISTRGIGGTINSDSSVGSGETCYVQGEYKQGHKKVCQYSCTAGFAHAITVWDAQICPPTVIK